MLGKPPVYKREGNSSESLKRQASNRYLDPASSTIKVTSPRGMSTPLSSHDDRLMVFEKIPINLLREWQYVLENTEKSEMAMVSMDYKNELLKLASIISDVLTTDD